MSGYKILEKICKDLPNLPGSYRMIDINGEILYIGKAKNIKKRVLSYLKTDLPNRLKRMVYLTDNLEYTITKNEAEAFLLEASLIKKFQPKYNIVLKDDKSFPYIQLTVEKDFPQILKYRGKNLKNGKFFGPFASSYDVDQTIQTLQKIFKIRSCSDSYFASRKRPCLQYQIKRCSAPCTNKISKEDYDNLIKQVLYFLNGKDSQLQVELGKLMTIYAEKMEYELAAEIRDRIKALTYVQLKSSISNSGVSDSDVIAICRDSSHFVIQVFMYRGAKATGGRAYFPRYVEDADDTEVISSFLGQFYQTRICPGEILLNIDIGEENTTILKDALYSLYKVKTNILSPKRGAKMNLIEHAVNNAKEALKHHVSKESKNIKNLEKIQQIFHLPKIPERIEIYDNSHIMGKFAVGAVVVAGIDGFIKNEYRKYNLDIDSKGDDYGMLREVIEKRIKKIQNNNSKIPDLMIIDGGAGHFNVVNDVMKKNNIDLNFICMSKGRDRNAGLEIFHTKFSDPFTLDKKSDEMKYLQILRDEVHNFAIKSHRNRRSAAIKDSKIETIPNIGKARKESLLKFFGSFQRIKDASIDELAKVNGVSLKLAKEIYENLNK